MCIALRPGSDGRSENVPTSAIRNSNRSCRRDGDTRFTWAASSTAEQYVERKSPSAGTVPSAATVNTSKLNAHNVRPIAADLYSGVGGMGLGFEQAGFDVAAAVDIEQIHLDTHSKNFPTCRTWCADLSLASGAELRERTGLVGKPISVAFAGPPCQGFSLIGKRRREDPRNLLLLDLARLIAELSVDYFAVENVAGLLLGDAKEVLSEFVRRIKASGYCVVEPIQVLDAAEFGVPQRRRRVFVLGYKKGLIAPEYPSPSHPRDDGRNGGPTVWDAIGDLPNITRYNYLLETEEFTGELGCPSDYASILRGDNKDPHDKSRPPSRNGNGLSGCLRTSHTLETIKRFGNTRQGTSEAVSRFYRLAKNGLAPTLRAGTGPAQGSFMAPRPIHPFQDRCITVREAARLHSFPDWFLFHPTKWHGFRQIGNSVPPLLARAVAQSVKQALLSSNRKE
jgi:DNA (cytosine-5)-methyltransferase 1